MNSGVLHSDGREGHPVELCVQKFGEPAFPFEHGEALAAAIPAAELLVLPRTGHDVPRPTWGPFVSALLDHTS